MDVDVKKKRKVLNMVYVKWKKNKIRKGNEKKKKKNVILKGGKIINVKDENKKKVNEY